MAPHYDRDDATAFGQPPRFAGGLFQSVLPDQQSYDVDNKTMWNVLTVFTVRMCTVINEAIYRSLLQSYRGSNKVETTGQMAPWHSDVTEQDEGELQHIDENINPTSQGFA